MFAYYDARAPCHDEWQPIIAQRVTGLACWCATIFKLITLTFKSRLLRVQSVEKTTLPRAHMTKNKAQKKGQTTFTTCAGKPGDGSRVGGRRVSPGIKQRRTNFCTKVKQNVKNKFMHSPTLDDQKSTITCQIDEPWVNEAGLSVLKWGVHDCESAYMTYVVSLVLRLRIRGWP